MSSSGFNKLVKGVVNAVIPNETAVSMSIAKFEKNNSINYCRQLDRFIKSITVENVNEKKYAAFQLARGFKDDELLRGVKDDSITLNKLITELRIRQYQLQVYLDIHDEWQRYKAIKDSSQEVKITVARNIETIIKKGTIPFRRQPALLNPEMEADYTEVKSTLARWAHENLKIELNYFPDYYEHDYTTEDEQHLKALLKADGVIEELGIKLPINLPKPQSSIGKIAGATSMPLLIAGIVLSCVTPPIGVLYYFGYALAVAASAVAGWYLGGTIESSVKNSHWNQGNGDSSDDEAPTAKSAKGGADAADRQLSDSVQHHLVRQAAPSPAVRQRKTVTFDESKETKKLTSRASLSTSKTVSAAAKALAQSKQAVSTAAIAVERAETVAGKSGQLNKNAGDFADMARQLKEKQAKGSSWF